MELEQLRKELKDLATEYAKIKDLPAEKAIYL